MLKDDVKTALRINHAKLDNEILETIEVAKSEMVRIGIKQEMVNAPDALLREAIKTYCKHSFAYDPAIREGFWNSWLYQIDGLRKSAKYAKEETNV